MLIAGTLAVIVTEAVVQGRLGTAAATVASVAAAVPVSRIAVLLMVLLSCVAGMLALPNAGAQTPSFDVPAPQELVVTSAHPTRYQVNGVPQVSYDVYLNFTRSTADAGTGAYDICRQFPAGTGINPNCAYNVTVANIAGRSTWVDFHDTGGFIVPSSTIMGYNVSLNLSSLGLGTTSGVATNETFADVFGVGTQNQTGNLTLAAPGIVNVQVVNLSSATQAGQTMLTFIQSESDPKANTTGDFTYDVLEQFSTTATQTVNAQQVNCSSVNFINGLCRAVFASYLAVTRQSQVTVTPGTTTFVLVPTAPGTGVNGYRFFNVTYGGNLTLAPFLLTLDVTTVDNLTGLIGQTSCQTTLDPTVGTFSGECGIFTSPTIGVPVQGTPGLPGLDGVAFATAVGLPQQNVGWIFAGILMLGLFFLGWAVGRGTGAGALAIVGVAFSYSLNLVQAWVLVVVFALSMVVIVYFRKGAQ